MKKKKPLSIWRQIEVALRIHGEQDDTIIGKWIGVPADVVAKVRKFGSNPFRWPKKEQKARD